KVQNRLEGLLSRYKEDSLYKLSKNIPVIVKGHDKEEALQLAKAQVNSWGTFDKESPTLKLHGKEHAAGAKEKEHAGEKELFEFASILNETHLSQNQKEYLLAAALISKNENEESTIKELNEFQKECRNILKSPLSPNLRTSSIEGLIESISYLKTAFEQTAQPEKKAELIIPKSQGQERFEATAEAVGTATVTIFSKAAEGVTSMFSWWGQPTTTTTTTEPKPPVMEVPPPTVEPTVV